jgi:peptide methionine sulfoxide reductase msrA/msrB
MPKQYNKNLTEFEKQVLFNKATERAFTGKYDKHFEEGVYTCKNCGKLLYYSDDKFDSGCGWPAFDDEAPGAITRVLDPDGRRIEIVCSNCKSHLGHVFVGEMLTVKNTRHCVNSASLEFIPSNKLETAVVGGGCFWGVEHLFKKLDGVISVTSGYCGGNLKNPTYQQVCKGDTGHYEVVKIVFDKDKTDYQQVLKYFFEIHDFEQADGQGPDIGSQYQSVIFYQNTEQQQIATKIIQQLKDLKYSPVTKTIEAQTFYPAEEYHQDYYNKNGKQPYCHSYKKIF